MKSAAVYSVVVAVVVFAAVVVAVVVFAAVVVVASVLVAVVVAAVRVVAFDAVHPVDAPVVADENVVGNCVVVVDVVAIGDEKQQNERECHYLEVMRMDYVVAVAVVVSVVAVFAVVAGDHLWRRAALHSDCKLDVAAAAAVAVDEAGCNSLFRHCFRCSNVVWEWRSQLQTNLRSFDVHWICHDAGSFWVDKKGSVAAAAVGEQQGAEQRREAERPLTLQELLAQWSALWAEQPVLAAAAAAVGGGGYCYPLIAAAVADVAAAAGGVVAGHVHHSCSYRNRRNWRPQLPQQRRSKKNNFELAAATSRNLNHWIARDSVAAVTSNCYCCFFSGLSLWKNLLAQRRGRRRRDLRGSCRGRMHSEAVGWAEAAAAAEAVGASKQS